MKQECLVLSLILGCSLAASEDLLNALPRASEPSFWDPALQISGGSPEYLTVRRLEALLQGLTAGSQAAKTHRKVAEAVKPTLVLQAKVTAKQPLPWRIGSSFDLIKRRFQVNLSKGAFASQISNDGFRTNIKAFSAGWNLNTGFFWQRWQASPAISLDVAQGSMLVFNLTLTLNLGD